MNRADSVKIKAMMPWTIGTEILQMDYHIKLLFLNVWCNALYLLHK